MRERIVEVQAEKSGNWGVFHLWQFREEDTTRASKIHPQTSVWGAVRPLGPRDIAIFDLRTREGAAFDTTADLVPQLYRHQIHVCVLFESFLQWLQRHLQTKSFLEIPDVVTLPPLPTEILGFRHGDWLEKLPAEAAQFLKTLERFPGMPPLPRSLAQLLKRVFPNVAPQIAGDDRESRILRGEGAERTALGQAVRRSVGAEP